MLTIQRTFDVGYCINILARPEIAAVIQEDIPVSKPFEIDVINDYWVSFKDGNKELGVALLHPTYNSCFDTHIHVLPEYRKEYTVEIGKAFWGWIEGNFKDSLITTNVPVIYENVRSFLLSNDFKDAGKLDGAFLKEGKKQDVWIMQKRTK